MEYLKRRDVIREKMSESKYFLSLSFFRSFHDFPIRFPMFGED